MRKEIDLDFFLTASDRNPVIAPPLKVTDCSLISDGAAAVIIAHPDVARGLERAIGFRAAEQVNDFLPLSRKDLASFEGHHLAFKRAYDRSEEHTSELQSLMRISYAVFCLKKTTH